MQKRYPAFLLALSFALGNLHAQEKQSATPAVFGKNAPDPTTVSWLDVTPPSIACINGISTNVVNTGAISIWTTDLLQSVSDNLSPANQIQIGIRKAGTGTGFPLDANGQPNEQILFNCTELGIQGIDLWAKDLAGNTSKCQTYISVNDNFNHCAGQTGNIIVHLGAGPNDEGVEEATLQVTGVDSMGVPFSLFLFSDNGSISVPIGSSGTVTPIKDDNPLNGVTTYDMVLIAKHMDGTQQLSNPYAIIAADANRDGAITEQDTAEFKKLILGIYNELPQNTSWRFVLSDYQFPDPTNPFTPPFPESFTFSNIQGELHANFRAIKIGDVNNTAIANNLQQEGSDDRNVSVNARQKAVLAPNPTHAGADLGIFLKQPGTVRWALRDIAGRLVFAQEATLPTGAHTLAIPATAMPNEGVYFWTVNFDGKVDSGKLIRQ